MSAFQYSPRPFDTYHPIGSRVRHEASGAYGTVTAWTLDLVGLVFHHIVQLDQGRTLVAPGERFTRAVARPGWHHEALVIEGAL